MRLWWKLALFYSFSGLLSWMEIFREKQTLYTLSTFALSALFSMQGGGRHSTYYSKIWSAVFLNFRDIIDLFNKTMMFLFKSVVHTEAFNCIAISNSLNQSLVSTWQCPWSCTVVVVCIEYNEDYFRFTPSFQTASAWIHIWTWKQREAIN